MDLDAAVSQLQHLDSLPCQREVLPLARELQHKPVEADGMVAPDDSPFLEAEGAVELVRGR